MLQLKIVQARFGDCFLLIFGDTKTPAYILIDGGPGGVYPEFLRNELVSINASGGVLEKVVLTHIDADHIVGLLDLTEELKENAADGAGPLVKIKELWFNSFSDTIGKSNSIKPLLQQMLAGVHQLGSVMPHSDLALQSIFQGDTLRRNALLLNIPVNETFGGRIITLDTVTEPLMLENLKLTFIGPTRSNLETLQKEWMEWIDKNRNRILSGDRELLRQMDGSVPNLSSVMFLAEADGKRLLFTGDGRGDFILEGLKTAGLLNADGSVHLDVFKVPHHGSIRNVPDGFFEKVMADIYIISADGRHGNPDYDTLVCLVEAASAQGRKIEIWFTNRTKSTDRLAAEYPEEKFGYKCVFMPEGQTVFTLNLSGENL